MFAGHQYFSLHIQHFFHFSWKGEEGLEESIHNEFHWLQLPHVSGVRCQIDCYLLALQHTFHPSRRKCISKSWKLTHYTQEDRIPSLFTNFDNIKDFPCFSLTVATCSKLGQDSPMLVQNLYSQNNGSVNSQFIFILLSTIWWLEVLSKKMFFNKI